MHEVLDHIEFGNLSVDEALAKWRAEPRRPFHALLDRWTEHAVRNYLAAVAGIPEAPGMPPGAVLEPVSRLWARQRGPLKPGDPDVYEETVTDRRYAAHGVRELRVIRPGSVPAPARDAAETAVAVGVLAGGRPVLSSRWQGRPLTLGRTDPVRLVRMVEIGCADASHHVIFEGIPEEAHDRYDSDVRAHLDKVITDGSYRPGDDCGRCAALATCPAVPSRPGLLGLGASGLPRRTWSVTTGRTYRRCPARAHAEDLFLPRDRAAEDSEAVVRGRAVHAWIEDRHRRTPPRPCAPDDVPGPGEGWQYRGYAPTGLQARLAIQMIGDHALVCPLRADPDDTEAHPERSVVVHDPEADVVVIAKTDLLYRVGDRWTLRETKTAKVLSEGDLLARYPQLALAVLLADAGALPGTEPCGVELERLTGTGPVVTEVDTTAADLIAQARQIMTTYLSPWHTDGQYPTKPGEACGDCPFSRWCPDAVRGSGT